MSKKVEIDVDFLKDVTALLYSGTYSPIVFAEHRATLSTLSEVVATHAKDDKPADEG